MKRKLFASLLCLFLCLSLFPVTAHAADIASGTGWNLDAEGCLHITGDVSYAMGATETVASVASQAPWNAYRTDIKTVVAASGASTNICASMFYNYTADIRDGVAVEYVSCEPSENLKELFPEEYGDDEFLEDEETEQA